MRLTIDQTRSVLTAVSRSINGMFEVYLFGSRLDDQARGGDVDLLIETDDHLPLLDQARIKIALEADLGLPVDIVAYDRRIARTPFQVIARSQAIKLKAPA